MNIVIHRYNSICEPDFIEGFEALGINVIQDTAEMTRKDIPANERIETIATLVLENHPLFVFTINFFPYIAQICEKLKCLYVCVSVDCPVAELFDEAIRSPYNRVFLFDYKQYSQVAFMNPECIFHMPLGVNTEKMGRAIKHSSVPNRYKYDVSFVGSLYNEKDLYAAIYNKLDDRTKGFCDGLLAAQLLMPGQELLEETVTDWVAEVFERADSRFYAPDSCGADIKKYTAINDYLSRHLTVIDRTESLNAMAGVAKVDFFTRSDTSALKGVNLHGGVNSLTEMPLVFAESKINLNMTMRSIQMGLPQRIWDILGCGGFLLTDYRAEIPEYFEIGKHLEAYETLDEACEKIEYYLSHEDERKAIANAGFELVKSRDTYNHRVSEIIKIVSNSLG